MPNDTTAHRDRHADGRYRHEPACDCCGKPCVPRGDDCGYMTDEAVCGATDGPGFHICYRKRCAKRCDGLDVEQRRSLYERQRAENTLARAEGRRPRTVPVANRPNRTPGAAMSTRPEPEFYALPPGPPCQAVELYQLATRLVALRDLYGEKAVRSASHWLAEEAHHCQRTQDEDAVALWQLAELLIENIEDPPAEHDAVASVQLTDDAISAAPEPPATLAPTDLLIAKELFAHLEQMDPAKRTTFEHYAFQRLLGFISDDRRKNATGTPPAASKETSR